MSKIDGYPSMSDVAQAILAICPAHGSARFVPSKVREHLARSFTNTHAGALSAKIQPALRQFCYHNIVALLPTHQKRNRPYEIKNRDMLGKVAMEDPHSLSLMHLTPDTVEAQDDGAVSGQRDDPVARLSRLEEDAHDLHILLEDAEARIAELEKKRLSEQDRLDKMEEALQRCDLSDVEALVAKMESTLAKVKQKMRNTAALWDD
jgi:hypothetical protein